MQLISNVMVTLSKFNVFNGLKIGNGQSHTLLFAHTWKHFSLFKRITSFLMLLTEVCNFTTCVKAAIVSFYPIKRQLI